MRKSQLIALILVAIMAVAVIPAMAVAQHQSNPAPAAPQMSIVGQTRTPTMTVGWTPTYPTRSQTFTVWQRLTWGAANLPSKPVWIYYKQSYEYTWHFWQIQHTSTTGYLQISDSWSNTRAVQYLLKFPGDSVYYPVSKQVTVLIGATTTSAVVSPKTTTQKMYGYVKDAYGNGIVGGQLRLWYQTWTATTGYSAWQLSSHTPVTTTGGYWEVTEHFGGLWVRYHVSFEGYPISSTSKYWESSATTLWIDAT